MNTNLQPGTALNVTVYGNDTKIEAPYKAKLIAFYDDSSDNITRHIESTVSGGY